MIKMYSIPGKATLKSWNSRVGKGKHWGSSELIPKEKSKDRACREMIAHTSRSKRKDKADHCESF